MSECVICHRPIPKGVKTITCGLPDCFKSVDEVMYTRPVSLDRVKASRVGGHTMAKELKGTKITERILAVGTVLVAVFKDKEYTAKVQKGEADGKLKYVLEDGTSFNSPSMAGVHITGRHLNGWNFWRILKAGSGAKIAPVIKSQGEKKPATTKTVKTAKDAKTVSAKADKKPLTKAAQTHKGGAKASKKTSKNSTPASEPATVTPAVESATEPVTA